MVHDGASKGSCQDQPSSMRVSEPSAGLAFTACFGKRSSSFAEKVLRKKGTPIWIVHFDDELRWFLKCHFVVGCWLLIVGGWKQVSMLPFKIVDSFTLFQETIHLRGLFNSERPPRLTLYRNTMVLCTLEMISCFKATGKQVGRQQKWDKTLVLCSFGLTLTSTLTQTERPMPKNWVMGWGCESFLRCWDDSLQTTGWFRMINRWRADHTYAEISVNRMVSSLWFIHELSLKD